MITISGTYADPSDAAVPAAGQVSLLLDPQDRTDDLVQRTQGPLTAVLDDTGSFSLDVPDSSSFSAGESQWHVRESISGLTRVWTLHLAAADDGRKVDLPSRYPGLDEQRYAVLPLPGPEGPAGPEGAPGPTGPGLRVLSAVPTVGDLPTTGNQPGDAHLVTATGDLHIWGTDDAWHVTGHVQGPPGPPGPPGSTTLDGLTDVSAPADTVAGKLLGTTAAGTWGPVDPPSGLPMQPEPVAYTYHTSGVQAPGQTVILQGYIILHETAQGVDHNWGAVLHPGDVVTWGSGTYTVSLVNVSDGGLPQMLIDTFVASGMCLIKPLEPLPAAPADGTPIPFGPSWAGQVLTWDEGWGPAPARDAQVREELGDPALLTQTHAAHDLVHWLSWLESRVTAVEAAGGGSPVVPTAEGTLEVDLYSSSFVRARDTGNTLADGHDHWIDFALATVAGTGGAVIDPVTGIPAGTAKCWYDQGGQLGGMVGPTGTDVTQTTLRNWTKYGRDAADGQAHYVLLAHVDTVVEPGHPRLVITQVVTLG
jgi:hypothetical protein